MAQSNQQGRSFRPRADSCGFRGELGGSKTAVKLSCDLSSMSGGKLAPRRRWSCEHEDFHQPEIGSEKCKLNSFRPRLMRAMPAPGRAMPVRAHACASACLREEDVKMMSECIALDMDCAQICRVTASLMARDSQFSGSLSHACAAVCEACGDECARHQTQHCQDCARACRLCAEACRQADGGGSVARSSVGTTATPR